ncbi:ArsR/SmtB family transcription factor [Nocardioides sp. MAHUQ-72]|uniref:ArsR/SmtB family transcription factor n=1 Tax=unclassified Nocardioides TaxID=2615069 RepID=UPI00361AFF0B
MPRKTAEERHRDSAPAPGVRDARDRGDTSAPVDALVAFHHPLRRRLFELLVLEGPAPVGVLARRLGVAVGSVSHHLKPLHAQGFVEPAPELARDTRQSWWRALPRRLSWSVLDYDSPAAREVATAAERANLRHHVEHAVEWYAHRDRLDPAWEEAAMVTESLARATREQLQELRAGIADLLAEWTRGCREDAEARPDAEREPVFVFAYAVPVVR